MTMESTMAPSRRRSSSLVGLLTLALLALASGPLDAQQVGRITGRVIDASSGAPLGEAQVYIPGANIGALSRQDGRFRTRVPRRGATYYAVVRTQYAAGAAECGSSRSRKVRVRRR